MALSRMRGSHIYGRYNDKMRPLSIRINHCGLDMTHWEKSADLTKEKIFKNFRLKLNKTLHFIFQ